MTFLLCVQVLLPSGIILETERSSQNRCLIHLGKNIGGSVQKDMIASLLHQVIEYEAQAAQYAEIKKYH